jgi:hypothetical protein
MAAALKRSEAAMGVVSQILRSAKPGVTIAGAVGVGAVAAQVGGTALRTFPTVAKFEAGSTYKEAAVDLAGGLAIDAVLLTAAGMVWDKRASYELAPYLLGGTVVSAIAPLMQEHVAMLVEKAVDVLTPGGGYDVPALAQPTQRRALVSASFDV